MTRQNRSTRRRFLQNTAVAGALGAPLLLPARVLGRDGATSPNEQIGMGAVGVGRQGSGVYAAACSKKGVRPVAVADASLPRAEKVGKHRGAEAYRDYRELLERKDIDAITTATPDHWRAIVTVHACQAGKDVYAEKPLTLTIAEGRRMVEAARKHGRIVQTGSQQRSMGANRFGCELVRNGRIGKIKQVLGANYPSPWTFTFDAQPVPEGLDWDLWCGPVAVQPYHVDFATPRRSPGWISHRLFSGGEVTGWGAHGIDQIQWALGKDDTGPTEIWTEGPEFDEPHFTEPHSRGKGESRTKQPIVYFRYADGITVKMDGSNPGGGTFIGEDGKIEIFRGRIGTNPAELKGEKIADDEIHLYQSSDHMQNWIDCIRTREEPIADVEIGHRSATVCHLINIARWTGRRLKWDPTAERFVGDDDANQHLDIERRKGYELPQA